MSMVLSYAGIGSRQTPPEVLRCMYALAYDLADDGWMLRSGGAAGADTYFEEGASAANEDLVDIFGSDWGNGSTRARSIAQSVINALNHEDGESIPPLSRMKRVTQGLIARNMAIILGGELDDPCSFVICWTPNGELVGGTRYALKLAQQRSIPIYNYGIMSDKEVRMAIDLC